MYETVPNTLSEIVMIYILFIGASIVVSPLLNLVVKGVSKWK